MKKIVIFLAIVIIIVSAIAVKYYSQIVEYNTIIKENAEYEQYKGKEIYGLDLVSIINKVADENIKNKVEKSEDGMFIQNDKDSIEIEIYMKDNDTTYKMETFYNSGTQQFMNHYRDIKFNCSKIEYHQSTNKIKYLLFEQR